MAEQLHRYDPWIVDAMALQTIRDDLEELHTL